MSYYRYIPKKAYIYNKKYCTMKQKQKNLEEWLTTIANTRLVFNTMDELEFFLDNRSIHNNGIKRCFGTAQKLRSAYRDLKVEVLTQTEGLVNLDYVLEEYQKAWSFFRENLYRRAKPELIALEMLKFCYHPYQQEGIGTKRSAIYQQIVHREIDVVFLLLMLMKAVPGYDSKEGDANDLPGHYERVLDVLENFVENAIPFTSMPIIAQARALKTKTRLMLYFFVHRILDTYSSYADAQELYKLSTNLKASTVNLQLAGYWNECGGELRNTDFWEIEQLANNGAYFMTYWKKNSEQKLTGIKYNLFVLEKDEHSLMFYITHPEWMKHKMKGMPFADEDHAWYLIDKGDEKPNTLPLQRMNPSAKWPPKIQLTRCTNEQVIDTYERWLNHDCEIVRPYKHLEYVFVPNLYAITQTHLYIPSENDGEFYKIPKTAYSGFENIKMTDNVGTMKMNGKTYLVFDEFLLYIGTSKNELKKYGIERVNALE